MTVDLGLIECDWQMEDTESMARATGSGGMTDVDWSVLIFV